MKRVFLFLVLSVLAVPLVAAEPVEHFRFRGIEVTGSPTAFVGALVNLGYSQSGQSGNVICVKGPFAGVEGCQVGVHSKCGFVWKATVSFPCQESWPAIKRRYLKYKEAYSSKFGVEPKCLEKLSARFKEGSGMEQMGFQEESSTWESVYDFPEGRIILGVRYDGKSGKMYVAVDYIDRVNWVMKEQIEMEDI